jgi:hypothetical protein
MTKPTKTKEELRSLILSEIAGHPVCPAGMDVLITEASDGGWQALNIPPKGPIAYHDCIQYIARIAARLRSEYDLSPEPPGPSENYPGWMNQDDAANQVVQEIEAARRRQLASMSSGSAEPIKLINPSSTPLVSIPKQLVDFSIADERGGWLKAHPNEVVIVFAARAALRVVPAITLASVRSNSRLRGRRAILRVFRAVATAWATAAYPNLTVDGRIARSEAS